MDYVGRRHWTGWHVNWTGHLTLLGLLTDLGADLAEWRGVNDGAYIKARTCRAWAWTLRDAVAARRIKVAQEPGADPVTGEGERLFVVDPSPTDRPGIVGFAALFAYERTPSAESIIDLGPEWRHWLGEFADFLDTCGGCWQR
jgi:hypothetical protein